MNTISPIPAFNDNYIWQLNDGHQAVVVDPGDAAPVRAFLESHQLTLSAILVTHHHYDHVDGIAALLEAYPDCPVYGPANPAIKTLTHPIKEGDLIPLLGYKYRVLEVPGHTLDHVAYVHQTDTESHIFCGDTLFACGCGRLFEGTPEQMYHSLEKIKALPAHTTVYCTHEYTLANIEFALAVEPENKALQQWKNQAETLRNNNEPTLPTTLQHELDVNPFLRTDIPAVVNAVESQLAPAVFADLRSWKDRF